jgi:hypothetical protein
MRHRDQWERLVADPSGVDDADRLDLIRVGSRDPAAVQTS